MCGFLWWEKSLIPLDNEEHNVNDPTAVAFLKCEMVVANFLTYRIKHRWARVPYVCVRKLVGSQSRDGSDKPM